MKTVNKKRIQEHVQNPSRADSQHGIKRIPLKTEHVVHPEGRHNERRSEKDVAGVTDCVGCNGLGRPQSVNQRRTIHNAEKRNNRAQNDFRKKADGHEACRFFLLLSA